MSHTITLKQVNLDQAAVKKAAKFLKLRTETGTVALNGVTYKNAVSVFLPNWNKPVIVQENGQVAYDNFNGIWGDIRELDKLTGTTMLEMQGENVEEYHIVQTGNTTEFVYIEA